MKASLKNWNKTGPRKNCFYFSTTATIRAPILTIRALKNVETNVFKNSQNQAPDNTIRAPILDFQDESI